MGRDHSWIDRDALRALAVETAWRRPAERTPPDPDMGAGHRRLPPRFGQAGLVSPRMEAPHGPLADPHPSAPSFTPSPVGRDRLTRASRPLRPGSIDPSAVTIKIPPPPPPAYVRAVDDPYTAAHQTSADERLEQLLVWALESTGMDSAFVADREGQLVAARQVAAADEASTTVFEQFLRQCEAFVDGRVGGHVLLKSGTRQLLVTWRYTPHGRYYLGLGGSGDPPVGSVGPLGQALVDALEVS